MTILTWIVLGLVAGWAANRLMGSGSYGVVGDIGVGILGAALAGWLGSQYLGIDATALNFSSVAVSLGGAAIAIAVFRALTPDRPWWQAWRNL
jgi:uncharacterized membrane protein YeaQ/YmgE (transglycosylase-associated protein family)